ncbi:MAG TPA: trypsin-like peptidase domain-containing protein [Thermoanaerobaculia bacterium]|nr:trypsin-like peptidase domain-containing protein [Thermoanaerobaculia bacterium]
MLRKMSLVLLLAVTAAAGAQAYDEMPMQVVKKGLTAEQHVRQQIELARELARELPQGAMERAVRIPVTAEEVAAIEKSDSRPLKVGLVKALSPAIGFDRDQVGPAADGGLVWATVVRADGAGAIRLHVQDLSLPRGASLYVYGRDDQAYGPYTGFGPNFSGDFWTTAVFGTEAVLQVRLARAADLGKVSFRVSEAGLITRKFAGEILDGVKAESSPVRLATGQFCGQLSCLVDATCFNVAAANPAKLAVAKMEWPQGAFIFTCTGGLIADNNPAQSNFFITANHCLSKNNAAGNVSFYWRFATPTCNSTSCPSNGGWPFVTTGSTVSATGRKGDWTLLRLNANPPAGSVLLGWTNAPVANTNGAQLYRISNPNFGAQVYSQHNVDTGAGTCAGWPRGERIYSRDITGAIDGGSSGSPILNASSQVVGQLSGTCGSNPSDACASGPGEANATVDGAFAFYYPTIQPIINP